MGKTGFDGISLSGLRLHWLRFFGSLSPSKGERVFIDSLSQGRRPRG